MDSNQPTPTSLRIVAGLFIFDGIYWAIEVAVSLLHNNLNVNIGLLALFIGPGLLRFSRGWRTCTLVFLWIELIFCIVIVALLFMGHHGLSGFKVYGYELGHASKGFVLAIAAVSFVLVLWQYRVLTRPDIRELFGIDNG